MDEALSGPEASVRVPAPERSNPSESRRRRWLLVCLIVFLALVPLPVGSNRPAFAALAIILLGICGAGFFGAAALDRRHYVGALPDPVLTAMYGLVCLILFVQVIPMSIPGFTQTLPGGADLRTLSFAPGMTLGMLVQMLGYGLFALLVVQISVRTHAAQTLLTAAFAIAVAYAALGLVMLTQWGDSYFGLPKEYYLGSATGPFVNRNSFATFLAMGLSTGVVLLCERLGSHGRRLDVRSAAIAVGIATIAFALFETNSRMGIFAGLAGGLLALVVGAVKARFSRWQWLLVAIGLVGGGVWLAPQLGSGVLDRLLVVEGALESRLVLYDQVLTMIASYPWTGVGGGAFEWAFPLFHQPPLSASYVWDKAHSTYLALWAELGILGGTLPILMFLVLGARAARNALWSGDRWAPGLAAVAGLVVVALHSLVDFSLEIPANAYFILAILVAGAAPLRDKRRVA